MTQGDDRSTLDYATPNQQRTSVPARLALVSLGGIVSICGFMFVAEVLDQNAAWAQWNGSGWLLIAVMLTILLVAGRTFRAQGRWTRAALMLAVIVCVWVGTIISMLGLLILLGIPFIDVVP